MSVNPAPDLPFPTGPKPCRTSDVSPLILIRDGYRAWKPPRLNNPNRSERIGTEPNVSLSAGRRFGKRASPSQRKHAQSTAKKVRERNLPSQAATPPLASKDRFSDFLGIVAMQTCHTPCQVSFTRPRASHQIGIRPDDKVNSQPYHCCN